MGPAAIMCNLLPAAGNAGASAPSTSVYIREGLPPVPLKLAEKMHRWDYTDMSEILPEFWVPMGNLQHECNPLGQLRTPVRRWRKVADIATWVQRFATYVGVLTGMSPEAILKLMGNLVQIVEVSQNFGSLPGLGQLRFGLSPTGHVYGEQTVVKGEPVPVFHLFLLGRPISRCCDLCLSLTRGEGLCPSQ